MAKNDNELTSPDNGSPVVPIAQPAAQVAAYKQPNTYLVSSTSLIAWGICTVLLCMLCVFIGLQLGKGSPFRQAFDRERLTQSRIRPSLDDQPNARMNSASNSTDGDTDGSSSAD